MNHVQLATTFTSQSPHENTHHLIFKQQLKTLTYIGHLWRHVIGRFRSAVFVACFVAFLFNPSFCGSDVIRRLRCKHSWDEKRENESKQRKHHKKKRHDQPTSISLRLLHNPITRVAISRILVKRRHFLMQTRDLSVKVTLRLHSFRHHRHVIADAATHGRTGQHGSGTRDTEITSLS